MRSAIDVATKATPSLASSAVYRNAAAGEASGRVLDAYVSMAGVRRVLSPQSGLVGALGNLLYQPALQGVTIAVSPTAGGARVQVHSVLDPTLEQLSPPATSAFTPTLQNVMPAGAIMMLDVTGLERVAPHVLNAGASAGVAGGLGPLLSRLGGALRSEGINVSDIVSIFNHETALAIVPNARAADAGDRGPHARPEQDGRRAGVVGDPAGPAVQGSGHQLRLRQGGPVQRPPGRRHHRPSAGPGQRPPARLRGGRRSGRHLHQPPGHRRRRPAISRTRVPPRPSRSSWATARRR